MLNKSFNQDAYANNTNKQNEVTRRGISKNDTHDVNKMFLPPNGFQTGDATKMRPRTSNLQTGSRQLTDFHRNLK